MIAKGRRRSVGAVAVVVAAASWASGVSVRAHAVANASPPQVVVSQVTDDPNVTAGEAWVVTDPLDPQQVAVIWLATKESTDPATITTSGYCGVAVSSDGGRWMT